MNGTSIKPFIRLFKTPLGHYFYEINRNEIIAVNKNLFAYIKAAMDNEVHNIDQTSTQVINEYNMLQDSGYLSDKKVQYINHSCVGMLQNFLDRKIDSMTLQVTQNCNLRCGYCIYAEDRNHGQRTHSNKKMSFDLAKRAIEFYYDHSIDSEMPNISFYGGEPLLEFSLVKNCVEYANRLFEGRRIGYSMTTNATLLTEKVLDFLIKEKFNLMISLDGPKGIHDLERKFALSGNGSYDVIMKNIENMWQDNPEFAETVSISMVVNPENDYWEIDSLFLNEHIYIKCP